MRCVAFNSLGVLACVHAVCVCVCVCVCVSVCVRTCACVSGGSLASSSNSSEGLAL